MVDFGKKCLILTRVSTSEQDYQFQLDALYKYAEELGLDRPFKDISTKESGFRSMKSKNGFNQVIQTLAEHDCRIVLCTELSRLARDKYVLESIKEWFVKNKIQLYVKDQGFKLFNDDGEVDMMTDIMFSVFASFAQSEMKEKKKRLSRGLSYLLSCGYSIVGPTAFGYKKEKTKEKINGRQRSLLIIDEEQANQVRTIFDWYLNGIDGDKTRCSCRSIVNESIARGFDTYLHSISNVKKCLNNEGYTGSKTTNNRRKNPAFWEYGQADAPRYVNSSSNTIQYPPIISKDLFEAVQRKMRASSNHIELTSNNVLADKSRKHTTLLAKLIICPNCGHYLIGNYRQRNNALNAFYRCCHRGELRSVYSMPLFDTAIWSFCKSNWDTYLAFLQKAAGIDTGEIERRIHNIEEAIDTLNADKEEYIQQALKLGKLTGKRFSIVQERVSEYDAKIAELKSNALKEQESLIAISQITDLAGSEIAIEKSKSEMKKYIQLLVAEIKPIFKTVRSYIIKVKLNPNIDLPYTTKEQGEGKEDVPVYIVIDGIQGCSPKLRYIYSPTITYNEGKFMVGGSEKTLREVFGDEDDEFSRELLFRRLRIYEDDVPKAVK